MCAIISGRPVDRHVDEALLGEEPAIERARILDADTVHWHCSSLSRVQLFGLPRNDGT
jgi:hypothetical protein